MVRAVTFDAFGTIVDSGRDTLILAAREVVRDHRPGLSPEAFLRTWDRYFYGAQEEPFLTLVEVTEDSLARALADYGIDADPGPYVDRLQDIWSRSKAYPEVTGVLRALDGVRTAVVSNADDASLKRILERNGLRFDAVLTSEAVRSYKPRPRIFEAALEALRVRPADVVHVGDSLDADVAGARRIGLRTVWVNRPGLRRTDQDPAPDFELPDLRRLPEIVASLRGA